MPNIPLNSIDEKVPNAKLIFDLAINKQSTKFSLGKSVCDLQFSNKSPSVHAYACLEHFWRQIGPASRYTNHKSESLVSLIIPALEYKYTLPTRF